MKRIITYNLNGIRSAMSKGWLDWVKIVNPDIICVQEIKAQADQLDLQLFTDAGYYSYFYSAEKKGYSGVAIFSKQKPDNVVYGWDYDDKEGRVIRADYGNVSVFSVYVPSSTSGEERLAFKMDWMARFQKYIDELKKTRPNLIICGDYNICHKPIDIHNPISNANSPGFLPQERAWIDGFMNSGFIDSLRHFNPNPHQYTWWSFRANARAKNLGWRIDYNLVSAPMEKMMTRAYILPDAKHSDHCPMVTEFEF
ncbi:MAG TPA: exodeoxyribonuclease III [Bacteroidia bacterium]|jgi:exodeoxyribonuclease-3|nr:exodeoxyribonuclease III [Bacteroidia bacterium]